MIKNYFFVASTLPIKYILDHNNKDKSLILIKNVSILESYKFLNKEKKNLVLKLLSQNLCIRFIELLYYFLKIKLKKKKIIFFHECCWPEFDILIKIINPVSNYIPIVSMAGFKKIKNIKLNNNFKNLLKFIFFNLIFNKEFIIYYRKVRDKYSYFYTYKKYSQNVKVINNSLNVNKKTLKSKRILLLVGKEFCDDKEIILIYKSIITLFKKRGYQIYYKDHPSMISRLSFKFLKIKKLNPNRPFELIKKKFDYLIGCGSTPLSYDGYKSISIINLIKSYDKNLLIYRIKHLKNIYNGDKIFFPKKLKEIKSFIK